MGVGRHLLIAITKPIATFSLAIFGPVGVYFHADDQLFKERVNYFTMTELSLRLSALGRNVRVGDFYNYFTDAVFSSNLCIFIKSNIFCI